MSNSISYLFGRTKCQYCHRTERWTVLNSIVWPCGYCGNCHNDPDVCFIHTSDDVWDEYVSPLDGLGE